MRVHFHPHYCATDVAFDTTRKAAAIARSLVERPIAGVELVQPEPLTREQLLTVHSEAYVDAVLTGEPRELALTNELPGWDAGLARAVSASNGGVLAAARYAVAQRTIAGSLSSGLHHARREAGAGYCTFNGLAIAAVDAIARGARRVLVLDVDAHCGGGTASIIGGTAGIIGGIEQLDVSVDPFDTYEPPPNVRLVMSDTDRLLATVRAELARVEQPSTIDLVLHNAGMDPHHGCEGGLPGIDAAVLGERERIVFEWIAAHRLPAAWVLAGGYTNRISMGELVELHRLTISAAALAEPAVSAHTTRSVGERT